MHRTELDATVGVAALGEGEQVISGVAIGAGDTTRGLSGDLKVWNEEALREAADSLTGTPVKALHSEQEIGEVTKAGYEPGVGVVYEAEVQDGELARGIESGRLTVSVEAKHRAGDTVETDRGEAMQATDVRFTGLAVVQHGAAPSATAEAGEAAALSPAEVCDLLAPSVTLEVGGEEIDATPPDRVINAIEAGFEAKEQYADAIGDCGTGVGEEMGRAIRDGEFDADTLATGGDIASNSPATYLAGHEGDVDAEGAPTSWSEEEWTGGCAEVQQALWGFHRDWFEDIKEEIEAARESESEGEAAAGDLRSVAGVRFHDTATGQMDETAIPSPAEEGFGDAPTSGLADHYLYPADTKSESSYPVVDAEGRLRRGNVDAAWSLGARGGADEAEHDRRLMALADEFETPPEWAGEDEDMSTQNTATEHAAEDGGDMNPEYSEGDRVSWEFSGGEGHGRVADVMTEGGEVTREIEGSTITRNTDEGVVYVLDVWREEDGEYRGEALKYGRNLSSWDAPEAAQAAHHVEEAKMRETPEEYRFQSPGQATGKAEEMGLDDGDIHQHGEGDDAVFMPGASHESLMQALREMGEMEEDMAVGPSAPHRPTGGASRSHAEQASDRARREQSGSEDTTTTVTTMNDDPETLKAKMAEKEDRIETLEAELSDLREQNERLAERADAVTEAKEAYAEALSAHVPRDAETLREEMELATMQEWLADAEGSVADAVEADAEPAVQSGDTPAEGSASLAGDAAERAAELEAELETWRERDSALADNQVEVLEAELADLRGDN